MGLFLRLIIAFFLFSLAGAQTFAGVNQPQEKPLYTVVLKKGPGAKAQALQLAQSHGAVHNYHAVFNGFSAPLNEKARKALEHNPNVELIEPAFEVKAVGETLPTGVFRIDAEIAHISGFTGDGARVAVVDTGIDFNHPDLNGQVDLGLSQTFISRGKSTTGGLDDEGHGTHVAGTIAAVSGNNEGVIGVAPGATLVSLKVLNHKGSGSSADVIAALDYITEHNLAAKSYGEMIHVANFSLASSGTDSDSAFRRAFDATAASGCFIAVAAGNESDDAANTVPAAYDSVFTVSAMDPQTDAFAAFSNYGADVDIAAPGVEIVSTYLDNGYAVADGTSMATPHVAGMAALYVAKAQSALTNSTKIGAVEEIKTVLINSAEAITLQGDPDGIHEPLVNAQAVVGEITPPAPSLSLTLNSDKSSYGQNDTVAVITAEVLDELGNAASSIVALSGAPVLDITEREAGVYDISVDIAAFTLNADYTLTVHATDSKALNATASIVISKNSAAVIFVSDISYTLKKRNLQVTVAISDAQGNSVSGADVAIKLNLNGAAYGSGSALTGSDGRVKFQLRNAPRGTYTTTIDDVYKSNTLYDSSQNAADPGFVK